MYISESVKTLNIYVFDVVCRCEYPLRGSLLYLCSNSNTYKPLFLLVFAGTNAQPCEIQPRLQPAKSLISLNVYTCNPTTWVLIIFAFTRIIIYFRLLILINRNWLPIVSPAPPFHAFSLPFFQPLTPWNCLS